MSVANLLGQLTLLPGNLPVEGTLSLGSRLQTTIFTSTARTTTTSAVTFLTFPFASYTGLMDIAFRAYGYTIAGSSGSAVVSELENVYSFISGAISYSDQVGTNVNTRILYPVNATPLGVLITVSGTNLLCQVENGFTGNTTDWIIITTYTTVT